MNESGWMDVGKVLDSGVRDKVHKAEGFPAAGDGSVLPHVVEHVSAG